MRQKFYTTLRGGKKSLTLVAEHTKLVALQPLGHKRPFFMVDCYPYFVDLVTLLGADRPVFSLIGQEETQTSSPYSLADEADAHARTILDHQPQGPYLLGGCSASGLVAYEIARQLTALHHEVALLVLFDQPNPYFMREFSAAMLRLAAWRATLNAMRWREVPAWAGGELFRMIGRRTVKFIRPSLGPDSSESNQFAPLSARVIAARKYQPRPYSGTLVLVKRHRRLPGRYRDPRYGWGEVVAGKIDVCTIDAREHLEIFKSARDRTLIADKLQSYFHQVDNAYPVATRSEIATLRPDPDRTSGISTQ